MKILNLLYVLYKTRLLSPSGLYRLLSGIWRYGINLMALLCFSKSTYGDKTALVSENEALSYEELFEQSEKLSMLLKEEYHLKTGKRVGFLCKNHTALVKAIFSVSYTGADIYLLNAEMSCSQLKSLVEHYNFDFLIYDFQLTSLVEQSGYSKPKLLSCHDSLPAVSSLVNSNNVKKCRSRRTSLGKLVILTGGTTGKFKTAEHRPSLFNFLNPFLGMLTKLKLMEYSTAYIATPIYHGYGVAVLFLFLALGKKMVINNGFDAEKACKLIEEHKVEVATVVPLMVYKMLKTNAAALKSLKCIASGGAELSPKLVGETFEKLGDVLYNLYGTSEAGLNIIASPEDLRHSDKTIGRKIKGVKLRVLNEEKKEVEAGSIGEFHIKNNWSMKNGKNTWIGTGDLGYVDDRGYYFLCGRVDDMIVSAGENVYPIEVEQVLIKHPLVEDVAVVGIPDEKFGQRLKAFVLTSKNADLTEEELFQWLRSRVARYQVPKEITFVENMPYTPVGKLDKKKLKKDLKSETDKQN